MRESMGATSEHLVVPGVELERRWLPVSRVGAYVPGGSAPYPSSLVMTVVPGFGGQAFIPNITAKIAGLRKMITEKSLQTLIEVDGGVSVKTIADISAAGADVFVSGSAIFGSPDYRQTILSLRQLANR